MIRYEKGNLFDFIEPNVVIPHVVNSKGRMGAGFAKALYTKWPKVKEEYCLWHDELVFKHPPFAFGNVLFLSVQQGIEVANMLAQTLYERKRELRYDALVDCMRKVYDYCVLTHCSILAPQFGAGLAGGNWDFIECLIEDIWGDLDVLIVRYK